MIIFLLLKICVGPILNIASPATRKQAWLALAVSALILNLCISGQAESKTPDVKTQIEALQFQIDQLKTEYGMQNKTAAVSSGGAVEQTSGTFKYTPPSVDQVFDTCTVCPPAAKESKYPTVKLTGFFQVDAGWFHQDDANKAVVGDIQDGADFRRARLAAVGDVWENVGYMLEMDFAFPGRPSFMDVWFEIKDEEAGNFRIGQFRHPFGMDGQTSVKELTFLERGLPFTFPPFRQIGMMYYGHTEDEMATWAVSGFRFPTDAFGGNIGDSGGYGGAARLTGVLLDDGCDNIVHIGGGYVYIDPSSDLVQYRNQPEFFVSETGGAPLVPPGVLTNVPFFVDTNTLATEHVNMINGELASTSGPLHTQAEIFYTMVSQLNGSSLTFSGGYAQVGYILTGEHRPYNRKGGVLGRVVPDNPFGHGGTGAWEVAARWSYLDLDDDTVQGGKLNDVTLGLNWYLNKNTKFQLNYIHAFLNSSSAVYGPVVKDSDADIVAVRGQVDF
ncbi:MAG: porin [Planctomycetaceae bacterium]